jgi:hypothetical protein
MCCPAEETIVRMKIAVLLSTLLPFWVPPVWAAAGSESLVNGRRAVVLESDEARVAIDLAGGSIVDFHLRKQGLNPLQWEEPGAKTAPRPMGHFLCLDRWGAPSPAEQKNGMPFHGEAARVEWQVRQPPHREGDWIVAEMGATLPLAGLKIERRIRLSTRGAFFTTRDAVTNTNRLGRIYNMVQHATIGPPFLDESTVVDANARKGFMQSSPLPHPEEPAVYWPQALKEGQPVDLRHLRDDPAPNVVSYTLDTGYGWATASNAARSLLIGYLWKSAEYPWFNVWRDVKNGKPAARGLEFGTTGLHQPYSVLVAKGRIFDRPLYQYLDAGQTVARSYAAFLVQVPADYQGVADLSYAAGRLVLTERGAGAERNLALEVGDLFSW